MIYVSSDWHGCSEDKIKALFEKANFCNDDHCYILGDVIDRGVNGVKFLQYLKNHQENFTLLLGNHEDMMLECEFLFDKKYTDGTTEPSSGQKSCYWNWKDNGGLYTMDYLDDISDSEVKELYDFLKQAPLYKDLTVNGQKFLLLHSGINNFDKDKSLSEYLPHDFLWCRPSLETEFYDDVMMIIGHTPTILYGTNFTGRMVKTSTWCNVDTGATKGYAPMLLRLDDMREFYVDE